MLYSILPIAFVCEKIHNRLVELMVGVTIPKHKLYASNNFYNFKEEEEGETGDVDNFRQRAKKLK